MGRERKIDVAEAVTVSLTDNTTATSVSESSSTLASRAADKMNDETENRRPSRLPIPLQFLLVVVLSFSLSSLAYSFLDQVTKGELATTAKQREDWSEIALAAGWRIFQLAFAWLSDYDGFDIAALTLLSHGPYLYLLNSFYGLTTLTAGASLGIDVLSSFIPFLLLRPLSGARSAAANAPYREIIVDRNLQGSTTLLAAVVYSTTLFIASKLVLPTTLVLYFEGIPSIQSAVDATLLGNVPSHVVGLLFGVASRIFIFTPVAATGRTTEDAEVAKFDPVGATLGETLYWNLWGFTTRSKVAIRRTVVAMFVTGINTFSQCRTLHGVEFVGAAIYAAVWVLGTMLTGLSLAYVGVV